MLVPTYSDFIGHIVPLAQRTIIANGGLLNSSSEGLANIDANFSDGPTTEKKIFCKRQLVHFCVVNDLAVSETITAWMVTSVRRRNFFTFIFAT